MNQTEQQIVGLKCRVVDHLPKSKKPELIVILCHGFGASGNDLVGLANEFLRLKPALGEKVQFVFPEAPLSLDQLGMQNSRAWWMLELEAINTAIASSKPRDLSRVIPEGMPEASYLVGATVEELMKKYELSANKMVLGGFSQGSMVTTDVALRMPQAPFKLIVLSGTLVCEQVWRDLAKKRGNLQVFQSHGKQDPLLPFSAAESLRDLFTDAGFQQEFFAFDGLHTIPAGVYRRVAQLLEELTLNEY